MSSLNPQNRDDMFRRAMAFEQRQQTHEAELLYKKILKAQPNDAAALAALGALYLRKNHETKALHLLGKAIDVTAKDTAAAAVGYYNLANNLWGLGKADGAVATYKKAIAQNPKLMEAYNNLGNALNALGRNAEAVVYFEQAIALCPDFAEAHNGLGNALRNLGRSDDAIRHYETAIASKSGYSDAHYNLGITLHLLGRTDEAVSQLETAIAQSPDLLTLYYDLAVVLRVRGRSRAALSCLRRAAARDPAAAMTYLNLGSLMMSVDRLKAARCCYEKAASLSPSDVAYYNLGVVLQALGREEEAVAPYEKALAANPQHADAANNLGNALATLGRGDAAMAARQRAIAIAAKPRYFHNLANGHRFTADDPYLPVLKKFAKDAAAFPIAEQTELHFALGKAFDDIGDREAAFRHFKDANALKRRTIDYDEAAALALFEDIARIFTADLMGSLTAGGNDSAAPIFVLGMPRSGTSLVEQILASHPKVHGGGELEIFPEAAGLRRRAADPTRPVKAALAAFDRDPRESLRRLAVGYLARIRDGAPMAERFVDKQPFNFLNVGLIRLALPKAKIIHVRRDPLDTCLSCFFTLFAAGVPFSYDLSELGRYYRAYERLMAHWREVVGPEGFFEVNYEDLVHDLEGQAARMLAACGLDWDPACLAFHRTPRVVRTASAAQVRRPLYATAVHRSRAYAPYLKPLVEALGSA